MLIYRGLLPLLPLLLLLLLLLVLLSLMSERILLSSNLGSEGTPVMARLCGAKKGRQPSCSPGERMPFASGAKGAQTAHDGHTRLRASLVASTVAQMHPGSSTSLC